MLPGVCDGTDVFPLPHVGLLTGRFPKRYGITTNPNIQMDYLPESHYGLPQTEKIDSGVFGPLRVPERGIRQVASWPYEGIHAAGARFLRIGGGSWAVPGIISP